MKKVILTSAIVAASVLALSSCQDKLVPVEGAAVQSEIALKNVSGVVKSAFNTEVFPDGYDMRVSAYRNAPSGADYDASGNFFEGIGFHKVSVGETGTWKGYTAKYWPLSGTLDFLCVAASDLKKETPVLLTNFAWNAENVASGVEVTVGDNSATFDDILFGAAKGQTYVSSGNPIKFKHAQAAVVFTAKTNVAYDEVKNLGITINAITVDTAKFDGVLKITNTDALAAEWNLSSATTINEVSARFWDESNTGIIADETAVSDTTLKVAGTVYGEGKPFGLAYVILPEQPATYFTITFTIHNGFKADGTTKLDSKMKYQYEASGNWEQAKKYFYNIYIKLDEITIAPEVVDWVAADATDVIIGQE